MFAHAAGLLANTLGYLKARLALAALEARAAGAHYGITAAMFAGALFIAVPGYVFLVLTAIFAIGAAFGGGGAWIAVMGAAAILHVGGAALLVWLALRRCKTGVFEDTRAELKEDQQWLTQLTAKH